MVRRDTDYSEKLTIYMAITDMAITDYFSTFVVLHAEHYINSIEVGRGGGVGRVQCTLFSRLIHFS